MAEKFPSEDVVFLSGMTDKALFHRKGVLVVNRNDLDKSYSKEYVEVDTLIEDINNQIQDINVEILTTKEPVIRKARKEDLKELEQKKKYVYRYAKKLINLEHSILIFLDTPRMGLLEAIMSLLSHDKYEVEYEFADNHNGIKTNTNILRGWPAVIYAQAIDYSKYDRWPEVQRRFIVTNPQMDSKKKYSEAIDLMLDKFGLPDLVYQEVVSSDAEKGKVRDIIRYIRNEVLLVSERTDPGKNTTFIPFAPALKTAISKEKVADMTSGKRFSVFLSLLPYINIGRRPMLKVTAFDDDGPIMHTVSFALFEDLVESMYLMEYSNGVRPYVLEWYYDVFIPTYQQHKQPECKLKRVGSSHTEEYVCEKRIGITNRELIEATKLLKKKSLTNHTLLMTLVYPLMNQGYIDSMDSELDHRSRILFPVVEISDDKTLASKGKNVLFNNGSVDNKTTLGDGNFSDDLLLRINIKESSIFPNEVYLTSRIQWMLDCYSKVNLRAMLCDHEGKEISIENLVNKYYPNPEKYFYIVHQNRDMDFRKVTQIDCCLQEAKTGSSYNKDTETMRDLQDSDPKRCGKFINGTKLTQISICGGSKGEGVYSCAYCEIINRIQETTNRDTRFPTLTAYEKHFMDSHNDKGLTFDPESKDLDRFESELKAAQD